MQQQRSWSNLNLGYDSKLRQCAYGCNHNPINQKGPEITNKNNQNWINIYVLSFKAMPIMANY
jgi:hypothetical protein